MNQMSDFKPGSEGYIDTLLSRFLAEKPHPWPECEASAQACRTPGSGRLRNVGRFALAASVVLFFVGYFTLAGYFPRFTPMLQAKVAPKLPAIR